MVTKQILEEHGCSAEAWKKLLGRSREVSTLNQTNERTPAEDLPKNDKLDRFLSRMRGRIQKGIDYNLTNYRTIHALDAVWEAPYRQLSPTLLAQTLEKFRVTDGSVAQDQVRDALTSLGLNLDSIMTDSGEVDPKTGQPTKVLNVPAFHSIIIPIVRAYLEIRRAKLINDRFMRPMHLYQEVTTDPENRMKCSILTGRVQRFAEQYGLIDTWKQAAFQMLLYGRCYEFTLEDWHVEEQLKYAGEEDVRRLNRKKPSTLDEEPTDEELQSTTVRVGDEIAYTEKEGLRYYHPHPSRMFTDHAHPAWTLNTETGCEYAGYWRVLRYKDILDDPRYFNKDRVSFGSNQWWTSSSGFFNAVYPQVCSMVWPSIPDVPHECQDREKYIADHSTYNESMGDMAVCATEYRERIIPAECGLGDYKYPIWARFVVAGDNHTVLYAEPLCYRAVTAYIYNGDDKRTEDASLALQLIPSQDMVSNLVSQYIYAVKQNLMNMTFVDEQVVKPDVWKQIQNIGERMIRGINIFKFDGKSIMRQQIDMTKVFHSHKFTQLDTNSILQSIRLVMDLAERVLQFSSQEVAQAASHEQTRRELDIISSSTTNILQFTGMPFDQGLCAQAIQLQEAFMNYGDDDLYAEIPIDIAQTLDLEQLESMGITYVVEPTRQGKKALVRAKKSALALIYFAVVPGATQRRNELETARAISDMIRDWFINNPIGQSALGPDQLVEVFNQCARIAGLQLERPIKNVGMTAPEQVQALEAKFNEMAQAMQRDIKQGVIPILQEVQQLKQTVGTISQVLQLPQTASNESGNQSPTTNGIGATPSLPPTAPVQPSAPAVA